MKKINFFIIIASVICSSFNKVKISCPADYRDSYIGGYFCHKATTVISTSDGPYLKKDTLSIYISRDPIDSVLQVSVGSNIHKFKLRTGILIQYPTEGYSSGKFFATDSIRLYLTLGHGYQSRLIGKKK